MVGRLNKADSTRQTQRSLRSPNVSMATLVFGHRPDHPPGTHYPSRRALYDASVHRHLQAGIAGPQSAGADSVVLSGGYEDDEDHGDWIVYTGQGGRDAVTGQQVRDQTFNRGNKALAKSCVDGRPVRVIRGAGSLSRWAPANGYRYDGLYRVAQYWKERSRSGPLVWRFRLDARPGETVLTPASPKGSVAGPFLPFTWPRRVQQTTARIVRDTEQTRQIKKRYGYRCQVCHERLETRAGPYAEAAHIRPLGAPHHGPDVPGNVLCLCPNHHVLFDHGAFSVRDDHTLMGRSGSLLVQPGHTLDPDVLHYHRSRILHASSDSNA